jgi:hypothetical protein
VNEPIDKGLVLAQFDEQVAAIESVCATMKACRLKLENAMGATDLEFSAVVKAVSEEVATAMDRASHG